jgi:hypothetical protein
MGFSMFSVFFSLVGLLLLELIQKFQIDFDLISFTFILYNFAVRILPGSAFS